MKIRSLAIVALVAVVAAGISLYVHRDTSSSPPPGAQQPVVMPSPEPLSTPNRALKPNEKFIAAARMYVTIPAEATFREETADNVGIIMNQAFYIEKGSEYQLYGLYQANIDGEGKGLEQAKKDMEPSTIKEVAIGGYKGIEGLVGGPKGRYLTLIVKDGKMISFSTIPPTDENKELTDQILSSMSFE